MAPSESPVTDVDLIGGVALTGGVALSLTAVALQTWFSIIDWEIARANARCATAPNPVPFHDSVTLCPGQSTILRIEIPTAPPTQGI